MAQTQDTIAMVNGEMVPASEASVSIFDRGFRWGDAVYDVERTYHGEIFRVRRHMERLYRSLKYTRIDSGLTMDEMEANVLKVLEANRHLLGPNEDFSITQVVTRGVLWPPEKVGKPNVAIYCDFIDFSEFASSYITGAKVVMSSTRRNPSQSLSPNAKISNKMNHMVAEAEVKGVDPEAYPLMLDLDGNVAEGISNNFLFVQDGRIKVPSRRNVLHGVTMNSLLELAEGIGIPIDEGDFTPFAVYQADEAFMTSTSIVALPVASLNASPIGEEVPGPLTRHLLQAWADLTGVDPVEQALSHLPADQRRELEDSKK